MEVSDEDVSLIEDADAGHDEEQSPASSTTAAPGSEPFSMLELTPSDLAQAESLSLPKSLEPATARPGDEWTDVSDEIIELDPIESESPAGDAAELPRRHRSGRRAPLP